MDTARAGRSLEEKLGAGRELLAGILSEYGPGRVAVAWTGGKDSTLVLHLWRSLLMERGLGSPLVVNLDTGVKFPEIIAFRDKWAEAWSLRLNIARPENVSIPIAEDPVACCRARKVEPLRRAVEKLDVAALLTGIRADEHPDRGARPQREEHHHPEHRRIHPILEFTEMDVWAATVNEHIPWCELYGRGYRSFGCVPCTALPAEGSSERGGRSGKKEALMPSLTAMGYF